MLTEVRRAAVRTIVYGAVALAAAQAALAQDDGEPSEPIAVGDDVLPALLDRARRGDGDAHLPYVLHRLEKALSEQNLIGFLDLVDPTYFAQQFAAISTPERSPGEVMHQFSCEFFSLCDVSKSYKFKDVVSARVIAVEPTGDMVRIKLEMRMWDGLFLSAEILYNPSTFRLSSGLV